MVGPIIKKSRQIDGKRRKEKSRQQTKALPEKKQKILISKSETRKKKTKKQPANIAQKISIKHKKSGTIFHHHWWTGIWHRLKFRFLTKPHRKFKTALKQWQLWLRDRTGIGKKKRGRPPGSGKNSKALGSINKEQIAPSKRPFLSFLYQPFTNFIWQHPWQSLFSLLTAAAILGGGASIYWYVFEDLPQPAELIERRQPLTTRILDRNGEVLFKIYKDENRTYVPLSAIPPHVLQATIAIEDKDFYHHHGFSVSGIARAFVSNLQGKQVQGGSTITQQLVKNRLLTSERTLRRKIREVLVAILVDGTFTKDEILEMYLNEVAYGGSTYGIEETAQRYFGKSVRDLTLAEAALLAGLPAAPSAYSPFGPTPELAYQRQAEVLRRMVEDGYLTAEQAEAAKQEKLTFKSDSVEINAPHFVMYIKKLLAEQFGEAVVNEGGLEVKTTLDLSLQSETQKTVTAEIEKLTPLHITNGAALVTNPETGEVLAMVGSKNYFDFQHDGQVNVTLRPRQPGSSIKPITYALAFENGKHPTTLIDDTPITYYVPGSKPYSPKNYDGKFHGKVTLREALGSSYNIPAVKLLAEQGINAFIDKGEQLGISTWLDRARFGLSITLGGGEVLMLDMAKAYGTFANQGYTVPIEPILEIRNARGELLYQNTCALQHIGCEKRKTLDSRAAFLITDVLKDNVARTPAFGPRSVLTIPNQEVAVKTGTTNNLRDNWTIGYTTDRLVAVWVGNNDNSPMSYVASGITGASPIWNIIMRSVLDESNPHQFTAPDGLIKVAVCSRTGLQPCLGCPGHEEYFIPGTEPKVACNNGPWPNTQSSPTSPLQNNRVIPALPPTKPQPTAAPRQRIPR